MYTWCIVSVTYTVYSIYEYVVCEYILTPQMSSNVMLKSTGHGAHAFSAARLSPSRPTCFDFEIWWIFLISVKHICFLFLVNIHFTMDDTMDSKIMQSMKMLEGVIKCLAKLDRPFAYEHSKFEQTRWNCLGSTWGWAAKPCRRTSCPWTWHQDRSPVPKIELFKEMFMVSLLLGASLEAKALGFLVFPCRCESIEG